MPMEENKILNEYTQDGTVDLKGKPVLRSKTGGWKACSFLVVYGIFERVAYYGISSNLILYLTKELHQGTVTSSNNVNNWVGTVFITPVLGAYIADTHLGRYRTFVISALIYLLGMCLLTLSVSLPSLKPPECHEMDVTNCKEASTLQLVVLYVSLYIIAVGTGGTKPNISTIGADQFDDFDPKQKSLKLSFFNWWMSSIVIGSLFAFTVIVYIQDTVSWSLGYALPTIGLAISIITFLAGTPFYRHKSLSGSPFISIAKVIVAATRKWCVVVPEDPKELYELSLEEYTKIGKFKIDPTPTFRFLNKACVDAGSSTSSEWMICPITQVEETKQILNLIPIWVATFIPSAMIAQMNTLFVKQGTTLDRSIGNFKIPPSSLNAITILTMIITYILYERFFVRFMQRLTKNPRGITLLQRMSIGFIIHIVIMIVSYMAERQRLCKAKEHGVIENGEQVPLSIFILAPQFVLMGIAEALLEGAKIEYFYDQAPESMKSIGTSYSLTTTGVGSFLSSSLLTTVAHITEKHSQKGWFLNNLNACHLDYYYAFLALLNILNFIFFMIVSKNYVYRAEVSDSLQVLETELKERTTALSVITDIRR
ncbi:protein NRT1/ PTR FAMILY 5.2-like isoform X1 [Trifolium pratense]|uniref:protein NRT1/ PTR FAMILY 5.2-like isoform X1 n=2 Tax=Trifolium pratense TaxID=57577 RepID=UPI001E6959FE|nr:protein NRT1/ PTR FAMILY 5.2-like isoform X1 [Trifolium pratense]